ncbi:MAG: marine proteobacterial sortase target protein, partial [Hyphomonadaceae bacterium]
MEQMIILTRYGLRTRPALAGALLAATCLAPAAYAQQPRDGTVSKAEVSSGSLLLQSSTPGRYVEAPLVAADIKMDIAGPIIRTKLTQRFTNPTEQWVEGVYAFPLPEGAAVDTLKIVIGDRFIEGDIKERQEARVIYEQAAASGQRTGLVEEERPNLFTTSLANIGPGETVAIQIEFQDKARLDNGVWSTRFPLVIAPRYSPKPTFGLTADRTNSTISLSNPVPDRDRITPPVLHPAQEPSGAEGLRLPVNFNISLEAGAPIADIFSQTHGLVVSRTDIDTARIHLQEGEVPADRDFVLSWKPEPATAPTASLFRENRNGDDYLLAVVNPPAMKTNAQRRDREAIFVIDNSGSMSGDSMDQAKQGLLLALDHLAPTDEFNIVRFDDTMELVFQTAVPANEQNLARARRFVSNLEANGGTEMLPALRAALVDNDRENTEEVRQVVFITDGAIGNEDQLFAAIHDGLGRSRLFTVGIGSAPNAYFMANAARQGRGTFTYMDDVTKVAEQSARLFAALENPVMTDLEAKLPSGAADVYPAPLPDLYAGEPVTMVLRANDLAGDLTFSGKLNGKTWTMTLPVSGASESSGVAQLWARAKIAGFEESRYSGMSLEQVDAGVLKTAL